MEKIKGPLNGHGSEFLMGFLGEMLGNLYKGDNGLHAIVGSCLLHAINEECQGNHSKVMI